MLVGPGSAIGISKVQGVCMMYKLGLLVIYEEMLGVIKKFKKKQ